MNKNFIFLAIALIALTFASCKKDAATTTGNDITGTWKFVSLKVNNSNTTQYTVGTDVIKAVSVANYTTQNNAGTFVFDASNIKANNVTYAVNTTSFSTTYDNGVIVDTTTFPFSTSLAPYSSTTAYTKIGNDSLYFPSGSIFSGSVSGASGPSGVKLSFQDDKMYMTQNVNTTTTNSGGQTIYVVASTVATLQR